MADKANKKPTQEMTEKTLNLLLLLLLALSFISIISVLYFVSGFDIVKLTSNLTTHMWSFFLGIPIPVALVVLGIAFRKKIRKTSKNIAVGILFASLLILFVLTWIFSAINYSYVNHIEKAINFKLPHEGIITYGELKSGNQNSALIVLTNSDEIKKLETTYKESEKWISNGGFLGLAPDYHMEIKDDYNYFMVYNVDQHTYNILPGCNGTYHWIYLAYQSDKATMSIVEYTTTLWID